MDAFSYLSVLLAVIVGLAITQVLQGYRSLALGRERVRWYARPLIWSGLILLVVIQHWWASFGLAERSDWSFVQFAAVLVQTALFYMMAALVLPDMPPDEPADLKRHYYREVPAFFGIAVAANLWNGLREYLLFGEPPLGFNLGFQLLFLALATTAIIVRRERVHEVLAGVMPVLFAAYIALLFAKL
jgi:hypothetical protein